MFAVLIPWVSTEDGDALLMEVRSQNVKQPGEVCFPGGKCEKGETPVDTALRETWEELGIGAEYITVISEPAVVMMSDGRTGYAVEARVELPPDGLTLSEEEVAETLLLPLDWLRNNPPEFYDLAQTEDEQLPPILRGYLSHYGEYRRKGTTQYWEYQNHGIWGLTARIMVQRDVSSVPLKEDH